jgi:tetratricopeptide (TPR) repeat protein
MRRGYFLFLLFLSSLTAFAITPSELKRQIDNANELRYKDSKASIQPLYDGFVQASALGLPEECARSLAFMGWALYQCGYPELSMQTFSYAQTFCPEDSTRLRDLISLGMGACCASTTDFVRGEQILLKGLQQSHADGNLREEMMIDTYLGNLYSTQAKEAKAKEYFERGREIAHELRDTIFENALYCNVGTLEPDMAQAEATLFRSIDLCQQSGDKTTECYAYVNLSELYYNNRDYSKALRTVEQINRLMPYIKSNDRVIAYSHSLLSQIYAAQNDYATAYSQMSQALHQQQMDNVQVEQERIKYSTLVNEVVKRCEKQRLVQQKQESNDTMRFLLAIIAAVLIAAIAFFILYRQSRRQQRLLEAKNRQIHALKETTSEHMNVIDDTRRTMNYFYGFYRGRKSMLEKLSQMVKESYKMNETQLTAHLRMINNTITQCLEKDKEPEFVTRLHEENEAFVRRLLERYPDLSKTDITLAVYYRLGMSTREISRLSGKLPATVTTSRYRLRTSLNIPEDADLTEFFNTI